MKDTRINIDVYEAPVTEIEKQLCAIWASVLRVDKVGVQDNFFDLGGNSLVLLTLHKHLQEKLNVAISVIDLFKYPRISLLSRYLTSFENIEYQKKSNANISTRSKRQQAYLLSLKQQKELEKREYEN
jgi:acyl carrier protein